MDGKDGDVVTRTQVGHAARVMMPAVESAVAMLCWFTLAVAVAVALALFWSGIVGLNNKGIRDDVVWVARLLKHRRCGCVLIPLAVARRVRCGSGFEVVVSVE